MDKYEERLEEIKSSFDYILIQTSKMLSREYMIDIHLKKVTGESEGLTQIDVWLWINGEEIKLGDYASDPKHKNVKQFMRAGLAKWKDVNTKDYISLYDMATEAFLQTLHLGTDLMDLAYVITKWKEENG